MGVVTSAAGQYVCLTMESSDVRWATVAEAAIIAALLHDFNLEFDADSPGPAVLTSRLQRVLATAPMAALLAGDPAAGVALVTYRPNLWHDGTTAMLEELYVVPARRGQGIGSAMMARILTDSLAAGVRLIEIGVDEPDVDAQRLYTRHGFTTGEPGSPDRAFLYWRELPS
ncbi:MAG TPA: GNAT family N-acetyltransferase [Actinomycetaceae bacterium]|nr:GNAT family N-acetyltransferase [Actinomycetaceae bacterium]